MNRSERRKREKESKRADKKKFEAIEWLNNLPHKKKELLKTLLKVKSDKDNSHFTEAVFRCFSAAIIQEADFLTLDEINRILEATAYLIKDDGEKIKNMKEEFEGDVDMVAKKIEMMESAIEKRARDLIVEGYNQNMAIKILREEFKEASTAVITNCFKKGKVEVSEVITKEVNDVLGEADKETEEYLEYIFSEDEDVLENKDIKSESKLVVINEIKKVVSRDVKGEYGVYHIEGNVVEVDKEFSFSSKEEVKDWAKSERDRLMDKINHINACECEALEVFANHMI